MCVMMQAVCGTKSIRKVTEHKGSQKQLVLPLKHNSNPLNDLINKPQQEGIRPLYVTEEGAQWGESLWLKWLRQSESRQIAASFNCPALFIVFSLTFQ